MAATLVLLFPIAAGIAWSANRTLRERQDEVKAQTVSITAMAAAQLEQYFTGLDAMASAITRHPVVMALEFAQLQDTFITMAVSLRDTRNALDRQMAQGAR